MKPMRYIIIKIKILFHIQNSKIDETQISPTNKSYKLVLYNFELKNRRKKEISQH